MGFHKGGVCVNRALVYGLLLSLGLAGCGAPYMPSSAVLPMLNGAGDTHVALDTGINGYQLSAAHALTDHVEVHGLAHRGEAFGIYTLGSFGVGYFGGSQPSGGATGSRFGLGIEGGGGTSVADITLTTGNEDEERHYSGSLIRFALQGDASYEWKWFACGLSARMMMAKFTNDNESYELGSENWRFFEPALVARVGPSVFRVAAQVGLTVPVGDPDLPSGGNLLLPYWFAFGLTTDFGAAQ